MSLATELAVRRELNEQRPLRTERISLSKLRVHPRYIRRDMGDLTELATSLTNESQHQLITVERRGAFFQILDGNRRFGAATIANLRRLNAEIVPVRTDAEALTIMLSTGLHTKPLTDDERRRAVRALIDEECLSAKEIAARCGVSVATIGRWYRAGDDTDTAFDTAPSVVMPRPRQAGGDQVRGRRTTVGVTHLTGLVDRWADRCTSGLSAHDAQALLTEIRELTANNAR